MVATLAAWVFLGSVTAQADEAAAPAGDPARGAKLAYTCLGCHAVADYRTAYPEVYHVPKLGGQHNEYLISALSEYRSGARPHSTMRGQAHDMTDAMIRDIAAYFSAGTPLKAGPVVGTAPKVVETCQACHGPDGVGILPEYPNLAGQHNDYIVQALKAYRKGARQNAIMQGMAAALTDEDITAAAKYFSSQKPGLWVPSLPHN